MKHLHWKIKYNYLMRYRNGESTLLLAKEMIEKKQSKSTKIENQKQLIKLWDKKFSNKGIEELMGLNKKKPPGKPKKKKDKLPNASDLTRE